MFIVLCYLDPIIDTDLTKTLDIYAILKAGFPFSL
jgi:hypothetical protein